jgi:hypothetical protein
MENTTMRAVLHDVFHGKASNLLLGAEFDLVLGFGKANKKGKRSTASWRAFDYMQTIGSPRQQQTTGIHNLSSVSHGGH